MSVLHRILVALAAVVLAAGALDYFVLRKWRPHELPGPVSERGVRVTAKVSDCHGLNIGADFFVDLDLVDAEGRGVFHWEDPTGQDSYVGVRSLVRSLRWESVDTLSFESRSGPVELHRDRNGWSATRRDP